MTPFSAADVAPAVARRARGASDAAQAQLNRRRCAAEWVFILMVAAFLGIAIVGLAQAQEPPRRLVVEPGVGDRLVIRTWPRSPGGRVATIERRGDRLVLRPAPGLRCERR